MPTVSRLMEWETTDATISKNVCTNSSGLVLWIKASNFIFEIRLFNILASTVGQYGGMKILENPWVITVLPLGG